MISSARRDIGLIDENGGGPAVCLCVMDYAKEKGLRRVYGDVLAENASMLQMAEELGFHAEDVGSGIRRVVLNLKSSKP